MRLLVGGITSLGPMALKLFEEDGGKQLPRRVTLVRLAGEIARALVGVGRVAVEGDWISIDQFLQQRKNTTSSVGVCPDCYAKQPYRK